MTPSVFVTRPIPESALTMLRAKGYDVVVHEGNKTLSTRRLIRLLKKRPYQAVVTLLTDRIDAKVFDAVPNVKLYANYATGYDNITLGDAHARGITVTNAPAIASAESVAEHTIALMLTLTRQVVAGDRFVRGGNYKGWDPTLFVGSNLKDKTLGLIGLGRIGSRVATMAKALGMKVVYHDVKRDETTEAATGALYQDIDEIVQVADVISLHVPLLESTRHLIAATQFAQMKPTAFLVNTSRGPVIDESALTQALRSNTIAGAALDVFEYEPKLTSGLRRLSNVVLTPHIASASTEAREEMGRVVVDNVVAFFEGRTPPNAIAG